MSVNLDRFSCGVIPKEPNEVGTCCACGETIYDYESANCPICDEKVHEKCIKICDVCHEVIACKACLTEIDGLFYCEDCKGEESEVINANTSTETDQA